MENKVIGIIDRELLSLEFLKPSTNQKIEMSHTEHQKKEHRSVFVTVEKNTYLLHKCL